MVKTRQDYENEIVKLSYQPVDDKESKVKYRLTKWFNLSDVEVYVANNEQKPWNPNLIGFPCKPMPTKTQCGFRQVGDYMYSINNRTGKMLVERKSMQDLYGTLFGGRDRFYREVQRFEEDVRFDTMYIFVEATLKQFIDYKPYDPRTKKYITTITKKQKLASLAGLFAKGIAVIFCDDERLSAEFYGNLIEQHCKERYTQYIPAPPDGFAGTLEYKEVLEK